MRHSDFFTCLKAKILFRFGAIALVLFLIGGLFTVTTRRIRDAQTRAAACAEDAALLQRAVADHLQWSIDLSSAVSFDTAFTGGTDPRACRFGKFIYSEAIQENPEWADFLREIEPLHNEIHERAREVLTQSNPDQAKALYQSGVRPALDLLVTQLNSHVELQAEKVRTAQQEALQGIHGQTAAIALQAAVLTALLAAAYAFIRRDVIKPIVQLHEKCERLSQGQLSLDFSVHCKNADLRRLGDSLKRSVLEIKTYIDDISRAMGTLSDRNFNVAPSQPFIGDFKPIETSIGSMVRDLSGTLAQIGMVADQVSAGSDQVASGAQLLAQGAAEQASSIEELAAAVEEISGQIRQNAQSSDRAGGMAKEAAAAIQAGSEQMRRLMSAMGVIDAKSREIGKIIKSIEDIAFQTNLLSLNAAVEAARAGPAGRGFAVVADEVRNLAVKSAAAAKSTTELIESSVAAIGEGVTLAQSAAGDLFRVVDRADETTAAILEIADATSSQAQSVSQISVGLEQISSVVQQNSATSEQSAAASQELSGQAQALKGLVGQFRLMTP